MNYEPKVGDLLYVPLYKMATRGGVIDTSRNPFGIITNINERHISDGGPRFYVLWLDERREAVIDTVGYADYSIKEWRRNYFCLLKSVDDGTCDV